MEITYFRITVAHQGFESTKVEIVLAEPQAKMSGAGRVPSSRKGGFHDPTN
jgi:hypothetical protein